MDGGIDPDTLGTAEQYACVSTEGTYVQGLSL
jgi:hypothetical protein